MHKKNIILRYYTTNIGFTERSVSKKYKFVFLNIKRLRLEVLGNFKLLKTISNSHAGANLKSISGFNLFSRVSQDVGGHTKSPNANTPIVKESSFSKSS